MDREEIFAQLRSFDDQALDDDTFERRTLELLSDDLRSADDVHRRFLTRTPPDPGPVSPKLRLADADDLLRNVFDFYGEKHHVGEDIDWEHNPGNHHWCHDLSRFAYLPVLLRASQATGDEKYARKGAELVLDWVRKNDVCRSWFWYPDREREACSPYVWWSYLNIAIHLRNWSAAMGALARFWTPGELLRLLKSMHDQLAYLERVIPTARNNWTVIGGLGMLGTAARLPELRDQVRFIDYGLARLVEAAERQVLPDGVQFELTQGYHNCVLGLFCAGVSLCRSEGIDVPEEIEAVVPRMLDYTMQTVTPDGHELAFNDSDAGSEGGRRLLEAQGRLRSRPDWLYVGTGGAEGTPPTVLSQAFEYGGVYVMRTGWTRESTYLAFDGGPWGAAHQHNDRLAFWLSAYGRAFLIDPGRYLYDQNNPYSRLEYLNTTRAHSTIEIDGEDQADRWFPETWQPKERLVENTWTVHDEFQRVAGSHRLGYGENGRIRVEHRRSITFWPPDVILVLDRLTGDGDHDVRSRLQFHPGDLVEEGGIWHTTCPDANLAARPMVEAAFDVHVEKGQLDPTSGWYSHRVNRIEPSPTLVVHARSALPLRAGFLLVPYKGEAVADLSLAFDAETVRLSVNGAERELGFADAMR